MLLKNICLGETRVTSLLLLPVTTLPRLFWSSPPAVPLSLIHILINSKEEGYQKQALELTEGKGFDYVFETAGNPVTMQMGFELAGNKAKVCFIGTPHVDMTFTPKLWENMNRKEFKLTGSWMSYSSPFPGKEWELTAHYFATGQLKFDRELIYKTFPMSRAQEGFALYKIPGEVKGKIMLVNE